MELTDEEKQKYPLVALVELLREMAIDQKGRELEEGENEMWFYAEDGSKIIL